MEANGDRCELHLYPGRPHGFFNRSKDHDGDYDDTLAKTDAFLVSLGFLPPEQADTNEEALDPASLPMVSARIVEEELQVIYNIPEGQHATIGETFNFMTVQVSETPGVEFGETVYPEGEKKADGSMEYHGIVILKKPVTIQPDYDFTPRTLTVTAGWQLCLESGVCLPPKKETVSLMFTPDKP
jgi:hypothetical protein